MIRKRKMPTKRRKLTKIMTITIEKRFHILKRRMGILNLKKKIMMKP